MKKFILLLSFIFWGGLLELIAKVGDKAPSSFILPDSNRKEHLFFREHIQGKKVVLNFFASYCLPCKEEIPEIQELVSKYPDIKLIFINIDESSELDKVESIIRDWNIKHLVLLDSYQVAINQYAKSKVAVPTTIIIGANGKIRFESTGYDKTTIKKIQRVLKEL